MAVKVRTGDKPSGQGTPVPTDGSRSPVPSGGLFYDAPGGPDVRGGLGVDTPLGRFGISLGPAVTTPEGDRYGFGADVGYIPRATPGRDTHHRKPDPVQQMTFSDFIALAKQYLSETGAGAGPDYSAVAESLRQQALQNDAKLQAMYSQLRGSIQADAPTIQGQFDQGIQGVNQNADQASGNINAAYQEARDAQSRQLAALGIQDAAGVLASQGGNAAADQAHAVGNVEQGRATGTNQLTQGRAGALNYNTNIGNAASLAGAESRSGLATQLQRALADLAVKQSESGAQNNRSVLELATQLQGQQASNGQALAEFLYGQQQDQSSAALAAQEASRKTFMNLLDQYGGDMQKAAQAFAQLQAAGLV